jgi:hypothetical protein
VYNVGMEQFCDKDKLPKFSYENKYWRISEHLLHDAWEGFSWVPVKDVIEYLTWLISIKDADRNYWTMQALTFCKWLDEDDKVSCMHDDAYKAEYDDKYYEYPKWEDPIAP